MISRAPHLVGMPCHPLPLPWCVMAIPSARSPAYATRHTENRPEMTFNRRLYSSISQLTTVFLEATRQGAVCLDEQSFHFFNDKNMVIFFFQKKWYYHHSDTRRKNQKALSR